MQHVAAVHAGLLALKAAIVGGPTNITDGLNLTWNSTRLTPCHDVDPSCLPCVNASLCGAQVLLPGAGTVRHYCNAFSVSCMAGRVANISFAGLTMQDLPTQINQLAWLQELGEAASHYEPNSSLLREFTHTDD
jgi:hypothetical protein